MAFEDAIASLGRDLGIDLVVEDGVAEFVAASADGGEQIEVTISVLDDGVSALLCADLGEMPAKGSDRLMLRMLEANHLFGATGGATLSVEEGRAKLERYVGIVAFQRGDGARIVKPFLEMARKWRSLVAGEDEPEESAVTPRDGLTPWSITV
ncbi:MAG: type III secretion system chaperone [Lentisphaerae bacterium]|jgi:hypothetical protein|nr:type III secretion system chaperone [Lentisphaerota bacterium]